MFSFPFPQEVLFSCGIFSGGSKKTDELANRGREDFTGFYGERGGVILRVLKSGGSLIVWPLPLRPVVEQGLQKKLCQFR